MMTEKFDYLNFINTIPLDKFKLGDIPKLNPLSQAYKKFWEENKRKCIDGYWVEHNKQFRYVPGPLHFYTNFWSIDLADPNSLNPTPIIGKPRLRDIEWIKFYVYICARGFSGFRDDPNYSCNRILLSDQIEKRLKFLPKVVVESITKEDGTYKEYVHPLKYLYELKDKNLGKAYFLNEALNIVDIETRNIGKTFTTSCFCGFNFLFDGALDYDSAQELKMQGKKITSETLIGAIHTSYSKGAISKVQMGLDNLDGALEINKVFYPPPLSKKYSGSWESGKYIIALREEKVGGRWIKKGSRSKIQHRTFQDSAFAANSTRPSFALIDEIGFCFNIEAVMGQMAECTTKGGRKFGTVWMTGTGGDMEGGTTESVKNIFYDPAAFRCMEFDNVFEESDKKIGFFVPGWMAQDQFRDELGNINREVAIEFLLSEREVAKGAKTKKPLNDELQQRPLRPSESFLVTTGNVFPIGDLVNQLNFVNASVNPTIKGQIGRLNLNDNGKVIFEPDLTGKMRQCDYPLKKDDDTEGGVVIWEPPIDNAPWGLYIAGNDPYAHDKTNSSPSVGSTLIIMRATPGLCPFDRVVAEYVGRPNTIKEHNENVRRLLLYYNGICLYESNVNNLKEYFVTKNSLHLLAKSPGMLKSSISAHLVNQYGLRMDKRIKSELEIYVRDWLLEEVEEGKCNLHFIYSAPLLKELIAYEDDGNYDRVISLLLAINQKLQMHRIIAKKKEDIQRDNFFDRKFFTKLSR